MGVIYLWLFALMYPARCPDRHRRESGQSTLEYVGILLVVGAMISFIWGFHLPQKVEQFLGMIAGFISSPPSSGSSGS